MKTKTYEFSEQEKQIIDFTITRYKKQIDGDLISGRYSEGLGRERDIQRVRECADILKKLDK